MARLIQKLQTPMRAFLLLLLISMQGITVAHELDQSVVHDGGVCAVCSIGGHHDGAIAGHQECPVELTTLQLLPPASEYLPVTPVRHSPEARAPPISC